MSDGPEQRHEQPAGQATDLNLVVAGPTLGNRVYVDEQTMTLESVTDAWRIQGADLRASMLRSELRMERRSRKLDELESKMERRSRKLDELESKIERVKCMLGVIEPVNFDYSRRYYEAFMRDNIELISSGVMSSHSATHTSDDSGHYGNALIDAKIALEANDARKPTYALIFEHWYALKLQDFSKLCSYEHGHEHQIVVEILNIRCSQKWDQHMQISEEWRTMADNVTGEYFAADTPSALRMEELRHQVDDLLTQYRAA